MNRLYALGLCLFVFAFASQQALATPSFSANEFCALKKSKAADRFDGQKVRITGVVSYTKPERQLNDKYSYFKFGMWGGGTANCFYATFSAGGFNNDKPRRHRGTWNGEHYILNFGSGDTVSFVGKWQKGQGNFRQGSLE